MLLAFVQNAPYAIFLIAGLSLMGIVFAVPTAHWVSRKMSNFLSFFPTEKFHIPPPPLGRAATLAMKGKVEEAAWLYETFLQTHPDDPEIYYRLIELAYGPMQDHKYGLKFVKLAKKRLRKSKADDAMELATSIVNGELFPLKHLGWCKALETDHPQVEIPETLKGQFAG